MSRAALLLALSIGLAAGGGVLATVALSTSSQQVPTKTVTINVENGTTGPTGPAGPAGPPGPAGPAGSESCPTGSTFGKAIFPQQGKGPIAIYTCIVD